jgi:hypothetical protein
MDSSQGWAAPVLPPPRTRNYTQSATDALADDSDELKLKSLSVLACITEFGLCRTSLCYDFIANKPNPSDEIELTLFLPSGAVVCGYRYTSSLYQPTRFLFANIAPRATAPPNFHSNFASNFAN